MKKIIILVLSTFIIGCSSFSHSSQSADGVPMNNDYQERINRLVSGSDMPEFAGFNELNINMASKDLALLLEADVYFNQGNYVNALPRYEKLAYQYKTPQIIYKAIICYQSFKNNPQAQARINSLSDLLIQVAPNTNMAKLLAVRKFLYTNDIAKAKLSLNDLLTKSSTNNQENAHDYLLLLSLLMNGDGLAMHANAVNQFADFVVAKYGYYSEAYLLATVIYASTNNVSALNKNFAHIQRKYTQWRLPMVLAVNILAAQRQYASIVAITRPYIMNAGQVDWVMENIYIGALINNNQANDALGYLKKQQSQGVVSPNLELNIGLVYAYGANYESAVSYLQQANVQNSLMADLVNLYVGLLYDVGQKPQLATEFYHKVTHHAFLQQLSNSILLDSYARQNNQSGLNALLNQMVKAKELDSLEGLLFKAKAYASVNDYNRAYNLLQQHYAQYKNNADYLYTYANTLALLKRTPEAIRAYRAYIKLMPKSATGYNDLAYVYLDQTTNYTLGLRYAQQAAKLDVTDANVRDTLGFAYYKLNNYVTAYPLIYSSYQELATPEIAAHLQAVLKKLNRADLAAKVTVLPAATANGQLKLLLAQRLLPFMMLLQYGVVNSNYTSSSDLFGANVMGLLQE